MTVTINQKLIEAKKISDELRQIARSDFLRACW